MDEIEDYSSLTHLTFFPSFCGKTFNFLFSNLQNLGEEHRTTVQDIQKWLQICDDLHGVIQHATDKKLEDPEIEDWFEDIEDLVLELEDMVNDMEYEITQMQREDRSTLSQWFSFLTNPSKPDCQVTKEIKALTSRAEEIYKRKKRFLLFSRKRKRKRKSASCQNMKPLDGSISSEPVMYRRETEMYEIIDILLSCNDGKQRSGIIPIVGMGGIGKTTLAQHVFKDEDVVQSFELRVWVRVSMDFDTCKIYKGIVEAITKSACDVQDPCSIQEKVHDLLAGTKFLIVLDDLWNDNIRQLDDLFAPFRDGAPDSKFVITTRNKDIADSIKTVDESISLTSISDDECWSLFCSRARLATNRNDLVSIGEDICKGCAGSPLATVVMGDLLHGNDRDYFWEAVRSDNSLKSEKGKLEIREVLKMSYDNLPECLKSCFVLCTLFPEDDIIDERLLVVIWRSFGVLKNVKKGKDWKALEDLGYSYFHELVSRSLLHERQIFDHTYGLHDLIREMGRDISRGRYSRWENKVGSWRRTRHLSIKPSEIRNLELIANELVHLRTFMVYGNKTTDQHSLGNWSLGIVKLRVLILDWCEITKLPLNIGQMKYLRILWIGFCNDIEELPPTIGNLRNLTHLYIVECSMFRALPSEIGNLSNLIHLSVVGLNRLIALPSEIELLRNLTYLALHNCQILASLPPEIGNLNNLTSLILMASSRVTTIPREIGKLSNLIDLDMSSCTGLTTFPSEIGNLTNLKHLNILYVVAQDRSPNSLQIRCQPSSVCESGG